jgi:hypothetical protein
MLSLNLHVQFTQSSHTNMIGKVNIRVYTESRTYLVSDGRPREAVIGVGGRKRQKPTGVWTFQSRALLEKERTKTSCSIQLTTGQHERPSESSGMADSARQEHQ